MMNDVIVDINTECPVGVTRFQILNDGVMPSFGKDGNIVNRQNYAIAASKEGHSWSAIGELTHDEIITLGMLIHRFIDETK